MSRSQRWVLHPDCYMIAGLGKRSTGLIIRVSDIVGAEVELSPPHYLEPTKYKLKMKGGWEFEIEEPDEVNNCRLSLREYVASSGGHTHYL